MAQSPPPFAGRAVVITGGTGALGTAVVDALLAAGADCHVPNYDAAELADFPFTDRVAITSGVDLADEEAVVDFYGAIPNLWASIHVAGGFAMAPLTDTRLADFQRMWSMNTTSAFLSAREAVKAMRRGSGGGRIVNVAARPALVATGGMAAYAASKAGVVSLTRSLAEELRGEGILVNAVVPSIMDTPANREAMPDADFDTWSTTEAVAATIAWLASPANRVSSGGLIPV